MAATRSAVPPPAPPMPLRPQHRFDWKLALKWLPVYLAVTFALYVLATGPLYYHIYGDFMSGRETFLVRLYYPLVLLCGNSETASGAMDWYLRWWV